MHVPAMQTSERLAQKEFLEQTPWANPQHPIHQQSRSPAAFGLGTQSPHPSMVNPFRQSSAMGQHSSPFSTPLIGIQKRTNHEPNGPSPGDGEPPSSVFAAPPTADRIQLIPVDGAGEGSPTGQMKRAMGGPHNTGKRDFSGLSSASTIETPSDPADSGHDYGGPRPPSLANQASAAHQAFDTSALHAQNGDARRPETYASGDMWRKFGAFGTPMPLGGVAGQRESKMGHS